MPGQRAPSANREDGVVVLCFTSSSWAAWAAETADKAASSIAVGETAFRLSARAELTRASRHSCPASDSPSSAARSTLSCAALPGAR